MPPANNEQNIGKPNIELNNIHFCDIVFERINDCNNTHVRRDTITRVEKATQHTIQKTHEHVYYMLIAPMC